VVIDRTIRSDNLSAVVYRNFRVKDYSEELLLSVLVK